MGPVPFMINFLYKPTIEGCTAADFIPFYENGEYHLFYLLNHDLNKEFDEGISWYKIKTKDFISFYDEKEIIPHGDKTSLDLCAFTGSVIKAFGKYYIFYTGHNIYIKDHGFQNECILRCVGNDLDNFTKDKKFVLNAPTGYDKCDFRDPFVYEDNGLFYMLICAKNVQLSGDCTGETVRLVSKDLDNWEFDQIVYAPHEYQTHECPDLFKMGNYWYLIFSEYSDEFMTKYRVSETPVGPWRKPINDTFDGRAYYAAKTAFDGINRYLFGWLPTKANGLDRENWLWGGSLIVHKLKQLENGDLTVECPKSIDEINKKLILNDQFELTGINKFEQKHIFGNINESFYLTCKIKPEENTYKFGIRFNHDLNKDNSYALQFDLNKQKTYITKLPNFPPNNFNSFGLERPLKKSEEITVKIINCGNIFIFYINNEIALSFRGYDFSTNGLSFFVSNGKIKVEDLKIYK